MQRPAKPFTPVRFRIQPPSIMKVGIIGYGFVGEALNQGLTGDIAVKKIDPKLGTNINDLKDFKPDIIFICVPTPMNEDGTQDISIIKEIINDLKNNHLSSLIILKSTILPVYINDIKDFLPSIVYNPEFLREKHALNDFINSELIVFGGDEDACLRASEFYSKYTKCINKNYIFTDVIAASLIKYTINSFLATKVIFFNEINQVFKSSGTSEDWENFISALSFDNRIGSSHMMVPGHDRRHGFGGACLPKDSNALLEYAKILGVNLSLIKTMINTNNKIRASYNTRTEREIEQNISFTVIDEE